MESKTKQRELYFAKKSLIIYNLEGYTCQIIDANGAVVVEYTYDAWGKVLNVTGSMADTLGKIQPFRYRGYVYDVETGLYYLRSRYYNQSTERFLNSDRLINANLYNYCENKPIIGYDSQGFDTTYIYDASITGIPVFWDLECRLKVHVYGDNRLYQDDAILLKDVSDLNKQYVPVRVKDKTGLVNRENVNVSLLVYNGDVSVDQLFGNEVISKKSNKIKVIDLQNCLNFFYWSIDSNKRIPVYGKYGTRTSNAIKDFQEYYNVCYPNEQIKVDGNFGPDTAKALEKYMRETSNPG